MAWRLGAWDRFQTASFWWMHAMVLSLHADAVRDRAAVPGRILTRRAAVAPEATYRRVEWLHRFLLVLSLLTIAGAIAGSMGVNLFALQIINRRQPWNESPDQFQRFRAARGMLATPLCTVKRL
jgi:hypothetical protein